MPNQKIQTLHPIEGKINKSISIQKYEYVKRHLLEIISQQELSHTELMEALYQNIKQDFEGGVQWYGEVVKLDLEARKIIERTKSKPEKYKLSNSKSE